MMFGWAEHTKPPHAHHGDLGIFAPMGPWAIHPPIPSIPAPENADREAKGRKIQSSPGFTSDAVASSLTFLVAIWWRPCPIEPP